MEMKQLNNVTMKKLPKFSIDLKASAKGERKKVVKYLRAKGFSVIKRKDETAKFFDYLSNGLKYPCSDNDFEYNITMSKGELLTLPRDWDKLVEIIEGVYPVPEQFKKPFTIGSIHFPQMPKFKVGDWVKWTGNDPEVGRIQGKSVDVDCYIISDTAGSCHKSCLRHATSEEIKEALIKEAEKRGFKEGVMYKSADDGHPAVLKEDDGYISFNPDSLTDGWGGYVYYRGQWAEIITDTVPEINGHKMEVEGPNVKFGCAEFSAKSLRHLHSSVKYFGGNRSIKSVTLDSGVTITAEQINEIVEYLNK
jgi:hypothetical protein